MTEGTLLPQVPAEAPRSRHYIVRHWRGELSLPVSYWVNNLLVTVAIYFISRALGAVDFAAHPQLVSSGFIAFWCVAIVLSVWQIVGVWRSAGNHVARGGSGGWALAVKLAVVVGVVRFALAIWNTAIPQIQEFASIVGGDARLSGFTVRVIRDASEAEISGPIGFGLTEEVRRVLDAHPTVKLIHLNSIGGRVAEARKLSALIGERGLNTYTASGCSSACVIAYLAGKERLISSSAHIGLHRYSFAGAESGGFENQYRIDKAFFIERGVSSSFVEKAFATPATTIWNPSIDELKSAHLVTRVANFGEVGVSGYVEAEFDQAIAAMPIYAELKRYEPETYRALEASMRTDMQKGISMQELRAKSMPLVEAVIQKRLPQAPDETLIRFTRLVVDELNVLYKRDPHQCYLFVFRSSEVDVVQALPPEMQKRDLEMSAEIIRTAATMPAAPARDPEGAQRSLNELMLGLVARFGDDMDILADDKRRSENPARTCEITIAMYANALRLAPARAGELLRSLYSNP